MAIAGDVLLRTIFIWSVSALAMGLLWWRQQKTLNATSVDLFWALGTGAALVICAVLLDHAPWPRRLMVGALATLWSGRLAWHLSHRLHGVEDRRYAELRKKWGARASLHFFFLYQAQAVFIALFSAAGSMALYNSAPFPAWTDILGLVVGLAALSGETLADRQLARFKSQSQDPAQVCRVGLWRYSRHPNYFFEWLHWWSYVIWAWPSPLWSVSLLAPGAMYFLIVHVTGIRPLEAQISAKRRAAYESYRETTTAFFPWWPKKWG